MMDHTEEIKKLIAEFREYQGGPEYMVLPMTAALDLIGKIEEILERSSHADNQT